MQNTMMVFISLFLGSLGAWVIQNYGSRLGIIDVPNERSSHSDIVPKGGGIGILAAFVLCASVSELSITFWLPALVLSIVSLFGDKIELSAKLRLVVQFICTLIFLVAWFYSTQSNFFSFLLILPFAVFIVGTANFYNFMDGINGIAGLTGIVGFLLIAVYGTLTNGDSVYITLCVAIAFSCVGFLPFNIPTAKVFMGDIGSILLGFVFACMVVIFSKSVLDFICLSGFLFPFYADELTTMVVRYKNGDVLSQPHRKHVYQLLANECGFDHWKISLSYGVGQLCVGLGILHLKNSGLLNVLLFLFISFLFFCLVSIFVRYKIKLLNTYRV